MSCKKTPVPPIAPYATPVQLQISDDNCLRVLTWNAAPFVDFDKYVIVRDTLEIKDTFPIQSGQVLAQIPKRDSTNFEDLTLPNGRQNHYRVFVLKNDGAFHYSNNVMKSKTIKTITGTISKLLISPDKKHILVWDRDQNDLTKIALSDLKVEKKNTDFFMAHSQEPMHLGNNGQGDELYVLYTVSTLHIYDAHTLELKVSQPIAAGYSISSNQKGLVFIGQGGKMFVYKRTSSGLLLHQIATNTGVSANEKTIGFSEKHNCILENSWDDFAKHHLNQDGFIDSTTKKMLTEPLNFFAKSRATYSIDSKTFHGATATILDADFNILHRLKWEPSALGIEAAAFSVDGDRLMLCLGSTTLQQAKLLEFDVNTGELLFEKMVLPSSFYGLFETEEGYCFIYSPESEFVIGPSVSVIEFLND